MEYLIRCVVALQSKKEDEQRREIGKKLFASRAHKMKIVWTMAFAYSQRMEIG